MELFEILEKLSVLNRDDGEKFIINDRLDVIKNILESTPYKRINKTELFHLYSQKSADELKNTSVTVVSSHIDCQTNITKCFSTLLDNGLMKGTYDNSITNAATVYAMLFKKLPENVIFAFTGDEEKNSNGAIQVVNFLRKSKIQIEKVIVLDVTDMGWHEESDFTIENNFWSDEIGSSVIALAKNSNKKWKFVPSDVYKIPSYVDMNNVIHFESEPDESWDYDEMNQHCFSLCLPVIGEMHSNKGVFARQSSFLIYTDFLIKLLCEK